MSTKLIVTDLDGTLLNGQGEILEANRQALEEARAQGVKVVIASGRMYTSVQRFAAELALPTPVICFNGALIKDRLTGEILLEHTLEEEFSKKILTHLLSKNIYVQMYLGDELYVPYATKFTAFYEKYCQVQAHVLGDAMLKLSGKPYKLLASVHSAAEARNLIVELEGLFGDGANIVTSADTLVDINAKGVSKWQAVEVVAQRYGIQREEIMCIGDSLNDLDMVAHAGIGVAMGNADARVKASAKIITASNEEAGVALAVKRIEGRGLRVEGNEGRRGLRVDGK